MNKKRKCLKKIASFHRNLDFEITLVLWYAASDLKMEVIFSLSVKICICESSLRLYEAG